jgi:hypothetical protein
VWAERRMVNVKPGGTFSNHWALEGQARSQELIRANGGVFILGGLDGRKWSVVFAVHFTSFRPSDRTLSGTQR